MQKQRLFIALPVASQFREQACALPRKGLEARWTHPDDLHITLRFLGDITPAVGQDVQALLTRIQRPDFMVEAEGLGFFQNRRQSVLWAAIKSTRKLTALAGDINELLLPLGFEMPHKPYVPHITLARMKKPQGLQSYIERNSHKIKAGWQADGFGLYLSAEPGDTGRRYKLLQKYSLK